MASEIFSARESSVNAINATGTGRQVKRLYEAADTERYPRSVGLGIYTSEATAETDKAILESVVGQMSDGIWENSPSMEKYWRGMTFSQDEKGRVELRHAYSYNERVQKWLGGRNGRLYSWDVSKRSGYSGMNPKEVRNYLATKIKQVYNVEKKDDPSVGKWSADNTTPLAYMYDGITVADAYSLYKRLKG